MNDSKFKITILFIIILFSNSIAAEAYFDISQNNIKIENAIFVIKIEYFYFNWNTWWFDEWLYGYWRGLSDGSLNGFTR